MEKNHVKEVEEMAGEFQKHCQKTVGFILRNTTTTSYQDATNVWLFRKLAEMQIEINRLQSFIQR